MEVELDYDNSRIAITIPENVQVDQYRPKAATCPLSFEDFTDLLSRANGDEFLQGDSPLIILNDAHRNTPSPTILEWLDKLNSTVLTRATFLIAAGTHDKPNQKQLEKIFGKFLKIVKDRIVVHDAFDLSTMREIGTDKFEQPVYLDKELFKHDRAIVINSVEPHYFAGFSGGRKSFFPGLTDFATIERNHNLANSLEAQPCRIKGNPMAEHLDELFSLFDDSKILSIQIVFDSKKNIASVFCGDVQKTFQEGIKSAEELYLEETEIKYDLILSVMHPPLDHSLYQAQKGLENVQMSVKDDGAVILVTACDDGIGSDKFYNLANEWDKEKNRAKDGQCKFGSHKLSRVNGMSKRFFVGIFSKLKDEFTRHVFYEPVHDLETFIKGRLLKEDSISLCIVHDSGNMVIKYKNT